MLPAPAINPTVADHGAMWVMLIASTASARATGQGCARASRIAEQGHCPSQCHVRVPRYSLSALDQHQSVASAGEVKRTQSERCARPTHWPPLEPSRTPGADGAGRRGSALCSEPRLARKASPFERGWIKTASHSSMTCFTMSIGPDEVARSWTLTSARRRWHLVR